MALLTHDTNRSKVAILALSGVMLVALVVFSIWRWPSTMDESRWVECESAYRKATTSVDTAAVDRLRIVRGRAEPRATCGELRLLRQNRLVPK